MILNYEAFNYSTNPLPKELTQNERVNITIKNLRSYKDLFKLIIDDNLILNYIFPSDNYSANNIIIHYLSTDVYSSNKLLQKILFYCHII